MDESLTRPEPVYDSTGCFVRSDPVPVTPGVCYRVTFLGFGGSDLVAACEAIKVDDLKAATGFTRIGHFTMDLAESPAAPARVEAGSLSGRPVADAPCKGKPFEHHHDARSVAELARLAGRNWVEARDSEEWACLTCGDRGRYRDFYEKPRAWIGDVFVTLDRLAYGALQDGAIVLVPSDAPPKLIGEVACRPVWRMPGIHQVMVAIPARNPGLGRILNGP